MRRVGRLPLSQATQDGLARLTQRVVAAANPKAEAAALWKRKPRPAFEEVRQRLEEMAPGRSRCMYCEDNLGTDIDHFWPKSDYPSMAFVWENYLLACSYCNSNLKRGEFPLDPAKEPLLLDPTIDDPAAHLQFLPTTGEFSPIGTKGPESIRVFGLNDDQSPRRLPTGRKQALIALIALLKEYHAAVGADPARAAEIKNAIKDHPFSAVLHWLVEIVRHPAGAVILGHEIVELVQTHQVATWR